jgi:rubrerythrin
MLPEVALVTDTAAIRSSDPWLDLPDTAPIYPHAASERLIRALEAYVSAEAHDLADYKDLARRTQEPSVKLLLDLIIEDEHRHQALLDSMVSHLEGDTHVDSSEPELTVEAPVPLSDVELAATLRTLIRDEHEGARHLRHVGRQEAPVHDGLYTLLLETIARDSDKHATILRFLLTRLERRPA